jgi:hypothetical protein
MSYGRGLFGWQEVGFRTPVELTMLTEVGAVILLSTGLAATAALTRESAARAVAGAGQR